MQRARRVRSGVARWDEHDDARDRCAKCAKVRDQDLVLVDVQGGNTPIPSVEQQEMTMALIEEQFLRTVVSKLCDNFLFVMGKVCLTEQKALLDLCKLCKSGKNIFVWCTTSLT